MTDHEYEILLFIRKNQPVPFGKIVNSFSPEQRINETKAIIKSDMDKYITKTSRADPYTRCRIRLTEAGQNALLLEESIRQENIRRVKEHDQKRAEEISCEKADREAEKRADRKFQIALSFLNFFLAFLAGVLIEHFAGIIDSILGLFS